MKSLKQIPVPALSWVVFLNNDMKTPLRYVEKTEATVENAEWAGTTQQFSVGAFPKKFEGSDENDKMMKAVKSGLMSKLSAPINVTFPTKEEKKQTEKLIASKK